MTYDSSFSPDAARHNHIDQRLNGILDFDTRNAWDEGQAALNFGSGTAIEFEFNGANTLIDGSKVSTPPNAIVLSDGHDDLWRLDHIYISEDGAFNVLEGEPGTNEYVVAEIEDGDVEHTIEANEQAGGPAPKGSDFERRRGELVYSVLVPPGANSPDDVSEQHIQDRRREAIDLLNTGPPRQPAIASQDFALTEGDWRYWPMMAWRGQTFRLWEYTLTMSRFGMFVSDDYDFYIVDHSPLEEIDSDEFADDEDDDPIDWGEYAIWESSEIDQTYRDHDNGQPLLEVDMPLDENADAMFFVVTYTGNRTSSTPHTRVALQVTYTIEETENL